MSLYFATPPAHMMHTYTLPGHLEGRRFVPPRLSRPASLRTVDLPTGSALGRQWQQSHPATPRILAYCSWSTPCASSRGAAGAGHETMNQLAYRYRSRACRRAQSGGSEVH
jgi:hypothetical protein